MSGTEMQHRECRGWGGSGSSNVAQAAATERVESETTGVGSRLAHFGGSET